MALKTLTTPESQPDIDRAELCVNWDIPNKILKVCLMKGLDDGNGNLNTKSAVNYNISGDDYDSIMNAMGDPNKMQKDQLEDSVWAWLETKGHVDIV